MTITPGRRPPTAEFTDDFPTRVTRTHALIFSMDETAEVGCDVGQPVSPDYGPRDNEFSGKVNWVRIDIDAAAKDADHMIGAEERFKVLMAKQ